MLDKPDGTAWHVHRQFRFQCFQPGSSSADLRRVNLVGTFRHNSCDYVYESDDLTDGTCHLCTSIQRLGDFRGRARRLGEDRELVHPTYINDRYVGEAAARGKLSTLETVVKQQRRELQWRAFKIAYLRSRVKTLKEKVNESVVRCDVRKVIDDVKYCARAASSSASRCCSTFSRTQSAAFATTGTASTTTSRRTGRSRCSSTMVVREQTDCCCPTSSVLI